MFTGWDRGSYIEMMGFHLESSLKRGHKYSYKSPAKVGAVSVCDDEVLVKRQTGRVDPLAKFPPDDPLSGLPWRLRKSLQLM